MFPNVETSRRLPMMTHSEPLTLWPEESLAYLSALQESGEGQRMTVTSGRLLLPLCRDVGPLGCLSRMLLASSVWRSTWCKLIWKAQTTKAGRMYFRLVPSVHRTSENASSFWRTPQAQDHKSARRQRSFQLNLTHQVMIWPTPTASNSGYNQSTSPNAKVRPSLQMMARKGLWPTPIANDASKTATGNLNPEWVENLMGLPIGWTALTGPRFQENHNTNGSLQEP